MARRCRGAVAAPVRARRRGGLLLAPVLLVVGSALTALALLAGWAQWQLTDTRQWGDTSEKLIEREEVRARVAEFVVDEVRAASGGNVPALLGSALEGRIEGELESARAKRVWRAATTESHHELVRLVEDSGSTDGEQVTLDLSRLIAAVAREIGVPLAVVPEGVGRVTIIAGDEVRGARENAGRLERAAAVLLVAAPLVLLMAVAVASGWRRRALAGVGVAVAVAGVLVLVTRALVGADIVSDLAPSATDRDAAEAAWSAGTSLLATMAILAIAAGAALALLAGVVGRPRERYL